MTVKELHDAMSMAYWKGVTDTRDYLFQKKSIDCPSEMASDLNQSSETYLDRLLVQIMSGLKVSVK